MTEPEQQLDKALIAVETMQDNMDHRIDAKPSRREVIRLAVIVAIVVAVLGSAVSIGVSVLAFGQATRTAADQASDRADLKQNQNLAKQAFDAATAANAQLSARGQAPVQIPPPDPSDPTPTIVAAAAARVLAQLPQAPTAAQVAQQLAADQALNPPAPSPSAVITIVADYLAGHPAPAGPTGQQGVEGKQGVPGAEGRAGADGHTPTAQEIRDAMCPAATGQLGTASKLTSEDGTTYTIYGCIVESVPPPVITTTPTEPSPGG